MGGGGGGQDLEMYRKKEKDSSQVTMRQRAKWANASETYIFSGLKILVTSAYIITINAASFYWLSYSAINESIPTQHQHWENLWICERVERKSLDIFGIFTFKTGNPSTFCWYLTTSDALSLQMAWLSAYLCRINKWTDLTPKNIRERAPPPIMLLFVLGFFMSVQ